MHFSLNKYVLVYVGNCKVYSIYMEIIEIYERKNLVKMN